MATASPQTDLPVRPRRFIWPGGLSARLLILVVLFIGVGGAIATPLSMVAFEELRLRDKIQAAETLVRGRSVEEPSKDAGAVSQASDLVQVAWIVDGEQRLALTPPADAAPGALEWGYQIDLRANSRAAWLAAPFQTLGAKGEGRARLRADMQSIPGAEMDIIFADRALYQDLTSFMGRLIWVITVAAVLIGALVYFMLNTFLVAPMQRITRSMERFRADPEDPKATLSPSHRRDEIGRAEAELERMQADLRAALASRARLAALGEAMAKINHDLRNMLTSAQMASDRLAALEDPKVAQALPRLERALDRAVTLTSTVLAYGKSEEPAPQPRETPLLAALQVAADDAGLEPAGVQLLAQIGPHDTVLVDPEALHRILLNLLRNAREALVEAGKQGGGRIAVSLMQEAGFSLITLADNGPGIPKKALDHLFQPFVGSARRGGTGLGLAIARELAQAHGGELVLQKTGRKGSVFVLTLPLGA